MNIKTLEQRILTFLQDRDWDSLHPSDHAKSIAIESAELLEHFQWSHETIEELAQNSDKHTQVAGELADVMLYCLQMSLLNNIDWQAEVEKKLSKVEKKYPAEIFKTRQQSAGDNTYWEVKNAARKKEHRE